MSLPWLKSFSSDFSQDISKKLPETLDSDLAWVVVFEEFHLPKPFDRFCPCFVWTAQIFSGLLRKDVIPIFTLNNHRITMFPHHDKGVTASFLGDEYCRSLVFLFIIVIFRLGNSRFEPNQIFPQLDNLGSHIQNWKPSQKLFLWHKKEYWLNSNPCRLDNLDMYII